jgi:hypothetical protein
MPAWCCEKDELIETLWPDTFVEESNLAVTISTLRKALGEMPGGGQYIGTLPRRGYRFAAEVRRYAPTTVAIVTQSTDQQDVALPGADLNSGFPERVLGLRSSFASRVIGTKSRAIALASILMVMTAAGAYLILNGPAARKGTSQLKRLAVLPFRNQKPGDDTDYLGFALADSVINSLDFLTSLVIRPSSYVGKYANSQKSPKEIARRNWTSTHY